MTHHASESAASTANHAIRQLSSVRGESVYLRVADSDNLISPQKDKLMKRVIIIPDGCADLPIEMFGGRTPLQVANLPNMNRIAQQGIMAASDNVPRRFTPGSEVANMALFGYDPNVYFTGRAPIEAAARGFNWDLTIGPFVAIW